MSRKSVTVQLFAKDVTNQHFAHEEIKIKEQSSLTA
jgi:hypothetical protein